MIFHLFCFLATFPIIQSYHVLLLAPFCTKSHKMSIDPAINELVSRGHRVTEVAMEVNSNSTGIVQYELKALRHHLMDSSKDFYNPFAPVEQQTNAFSLMLNATSTIARAILEDETFAKFRKDSENQTFDVVIVGKIFNDIILPVAYRFNAPLVIWCSSGLPSYKAWMQNVPYPTSYVTSAYSMYFKPPLSFIDRLLNTLFNIVLVFWHQCLVIPQMQSIHEEYSNDKTPYILDIKRNASIILVNSHIAMEDARPTMPNIIYVGAMHCRPPGPLPQLFRDIVSGSNSSGFIVFSLGSIVHGKHMPKNLVDMFVRVFASLDQKVIWKFEGHVEHVPQNVIIFKDWIPQQDLMGHPNCRLAILHGGLNSLQEAVYHGVPVLGIPLGSDRDSNLARSVEQGMAEIFDWRTGNEETLRQQLHRLLHNQKYRETAKRISTIFKDRPATAAQTAAYWIEYVIRHKGAPHLKPKADHLNLIQYFILDVIAFILTSVALVLVAVWVIVKFMYKRILSKNFSKRKAKTQ